MPRLEDIHPLKWDVSMATGITTIDKHHQYLFDTLQQANQHLLAKDDVTSLKQVVNDLLGYAIMHFETEEALMQRYNYAAAHPDEAQTHIAQHRDFSSKVVAVSERLREGRKVSSAEVLIFLNHWLQEHVLGIDQLLGNYLFQKMKQSENKALSGTAPNLGNSDDSKT
ncbi:MAG: bacteriohemerythrin [Candidatus Thiodiazotropha sp.]